MPTSESESRKKARAKYSQKNARISIDINNDVNIYMVEYCKKKEITKKKFLEDAIMEYLDRH